MDANRSSASRLDDFLSCCRLCFSRSSTLVDLFNTPDNVDTLAKIKNCLDIVITPDESPATSICQRCLMLTEQFYNYRQICRTFDQMFHKSIKISRTSNVDGIASTDCDNELANIQIKSEPLDISDRIEHEPLDIGFDILKEESVNEDIDISANKHLEPSGTSDDGGPARPSLKRGRRLKKIHKEGLSVRMIIEKNRMNCTRVYANGNMQWACDSSDCPFLYNGLPEGVLVPRSRQIEHYAVDSKSDVSDVAKMVWNDHEWTLSPDNQMGVCTKQKRRRTGKTCPRYIKIHGDFEQVEECGDDHNHQKNFFLIRTSVTPSDFDINLWKLFCQIDPCRLSLAGEMELPIRLKLFYQGNQLRLAECSWGGTSRWRCDTVNCHGLLSMSDSDMTFEKKHSHEPPIERQGVFNGIYYCVMTTNIGLKRIFYNGHNFGSRSSGKWICAVPGCSERLFVGENYEWFVMKGRHDHGGFGAIIKPLKKEAIYLTPQNPTLPDSITIEDLIEEMPAPSKQEVPITPAPQPRPLKKPKQKQQSKRNDSTGESQCEEIESNSVIRMAYDGHRYTLCEFFGDGTSFWRCWGQRCKKSLHMTPAGSLYAKNETIDHNHAPTVSKIGRITLDDGSREGFAVFQDCWDNTSLMYRNTLWHLVHGEGVYFASCKDFQITATEEVPCPAKIRISLDYTKFEQTGECINHSDKIMLVRSAPEIVEGDPVVWKLYQQKHPLYLSDGSLFTEGRNSHLFIGGYRYTLQSLLWNGSSVWRCSLQFCTTKGRISPRGYFQTAEHKHEKLERMQGVMWSDKRQKEERYIVSTTVKKTFATMYYNTYCYALKDPERNVWSCYPALCNATLRVEGDFQRVVDEMEHLHDGTLTFVRTDESSESQQTTPPAKGSSRKRQIVTKANSEEASEAKVPRIKQEPLVLSESRPKLDSVLQVLEKRSVKPIEGYQINQTIRYHGGYTYSRFYVQSDGSLRLECNKFRCPGKIVLSPDYRVLSKIEHTHSKNFDSYGTISDVMTGETMPYILVNGTHKRYVTYFVCNGYRYHIISKTQNLDAESEWQCGKCEVKITISNSFRDIQFGSVHEHDPTNIIVPTNQEDSVPSGFDQGTVHLDEVVWGNHRYTTPILIRRLNRVKWMCFRRKECKGYLYQQSDGQFEDMEPHNHEGPVETTGEARYDDLLKVKDRFAILKPGERPKVRRLLFQNHMYRETGKNWVCSRKSCNGALQPNSDFSFLRIIEGHLHQPTMTCIKFQEEIQPCFPLPL
ncbi:uncharacterized protein LOC129724219 isoform X2 [Wyeomyia smithii]|uniref:uncharacterized protein LOC129724219 isoform X2 n=1 Tax=Wyeomyia smithii TaxID=174621 RepID=UPI002467EB44|nr:uncharacterized protein LOC129724219 isoform X2 [Wyeomyia smithii]